MANSLSKPVIVMAVGGIPVIQVTGGQQGLPATVVSEQGMGITLTTEQGKPMELWNPDGTEYVPA